MQALAHPLRMRILAALRDRATERDWDRAVNVVDQLRVVLAAASALEKSGRRPLADERRS